MERTYERVVQLVRELLTLVITQARHDLSGDQHLAVCHHSASFNTNLWVTLVTSESHQQTTGTVSDQMFRKYCSH